jgi:tetratricopeptide (TPR) repeat protein
MHRIALSFTQRVLPDDHPSIDLSMGNLASTYFELDRHHKTIELLRKALAFKQRVLPEKHPHFATSVGNLASTYRALGRHDEALKLQQETLAFMQRVLPENHPHIATSMSNLGSTSGALGRHDEALVLQQETLAFGQRVPTGSSTSTRTGALMSSTIQPFRQGRHVAEFGFLARDLGDLPFGDSPKSHFEVGVEGGVGFS